VRRAVTRITIEELRENLKEILEKIDQEQAEYVVYANDRPVALVASIEGSRAGSRTDDQSLLARLRALRTRVPPTLTVQQVMDEIRGFY
jgi:hypothetical protein